MSTGNKSFEEGKHYYREGDRIIFTALFHSNRGSCCGNGCRHCPYLPKHTKGIKKLDEKFGYLKENT